MALFKPSKGRIVDEVATILRLEGGIIPVGDQDPDSEAVLPWMNGDYEVMRRREYHRWGLNLYEYDILQNGRMNYYDINRPLRCRLRVVLDNGKGIVFDGGPQPDLVDIYRNGGWTRKLHHLYVDTLYE